MPSMRKSTDFVYFDSLLVIQFSSLRNGLMRFKRYTAPSKNAMATVIKPAASV